MFDPDVHDEGVLVAAVVDDLAPGRHLRFTISAFGREVTFDGGLELLTLLWQSPGLIDVLTSDHPAAFGVFFHDQGGLVLTLDFATSGDGVTVTGSNPSGEFIPPGTRPPAERLDRHALAAEIRQVVRDVLAAGAAAGSTFVRHPVVTEWARRVGAVPASA